MKIQNIYHLLQAALLLLLVSCTQEEFPAVQDKAQQLTISVTDGGYTSAVENMKTRVETRAVENGYTTEFTEGDACGFYMVRGGKPVYSNVKLTAEKEGVQKGKIPPCRIGYLISVSNRDTNKSRVPNTFWTPSFLSAVISPGWRLLSSVGGDTKRISCIMRWR